MMVRDRWDDEDDLDRERDRLRGREPLHEPTLAETIDGAVRKVVTSLVIAGGLIALGLYASRGGGGSDLEYQVVTSADGAMVYRINTDSGSIVACRTASNACWLLQRGSHDLEDEPPANVTVPQPAQVTQQPQPQPAQVAPAQPAAQLPAPQNQAAPAAR
jgi:hypothetical protein